MSVVPFEYRRASARFPEITEIEEDSVEDIDLLLLVAVRAALRAGRGGVRLAAPARRFDAALDVVI